MDGVYRPVSLVATYTNPAQVESDGTAEMIFQFCVEALSGDSTTAVNSNLMAYRFWAE